MGWLWSGREEWPRHQRAPAHCDPVWTVGKVDPPWQFPAGDPDYDAMYAWVDAIATGPAE